MAEKDTRPDPARKSREHPEASQPLCPQCGEPLQDCDCAKRWENEGGAPYPRKNGKPD
jgi:hypothetical protein